MSAADNLKTIRERVEAATEGPWKLSEKYPAVIADADVPDAPWTDADNLAAYGGALVGESIMKPTDAEFIAHARTDLPRLLDAVEAVLKEMADMDKSREGILSRREIGPDEAVTARTLGVVEARLNMAITTALEGK